MKLVKPSHSYFLPALEAAQSTAKMQGQLNVGVPAARKLQAVHFNFRSAYILDRPLIIKLHSLNQNYWGKGEVIHGNISGNLSRTYCVRRPLLRTNDLTFSSGHIFEYKKVDICVPRAQENQKHTFSSSFLPVIWIHHSAGPWTKHFLTYWSII